MSQLLLNLEETSHRLVNAESAFLEASQRAHGLSRRVSRQSGELSRYRLLCKFRSPRTSFELWPVGVILVSVVFCATVAFLGVHTLGTSIATGVFMVIVAAAIGASTAWILLFRPDD